MAYFKKRDNSFVCSVCGRSVGELKYSSRDHCSECLCSLHVDNFPGDRENGCGGILRPVSAIRNQKGFVIIFRCEKCGEIKKNKAADDDNTELIIELTAKPFKILE